MFRSRLRARPSRATSAIAMTISTMRCQRAGGGTEAISQRCTQIAAADRQHQAERKRRIRRTAIERHAGQDLVHRPKRRRVLAERVEQRQHQHRGEEADFARPQQAAHDAETDHRDDHQRAGVELADVLRMKQIGRAERVMPGKARRSPVRHLGIGCAEQIGEHQCEQVGGRQRAADGDVVADLRPVG